LRAALVLALLLVLSLASTSSAAVIAFNRDDYTFTFSQSVSGLTLWTAPATYRVTGDDTTAPAAQGSTLRISCALEELESFQVVVAGTSAFTSLTVTMTNFTGLGAATWIDVGRAIFSPMSPWSHGTRQMADLTDRVASGGSVALSATMPTVLWITIYVPKAGSSPGVKTASLQLNAIGGNGAQITLPIELTVFNFALDRTPHFETFLMSQPSIEADTIEVRDAWKEVYLQHRMSSTNPSWPNGYNWQVAWNCSGESLLDVDNSTSREQCVWANGCTGLRYGLGKGSTWRGQTFGDWIDRGFPQLMAVTTDNGRPSSFCGVPCATSSTRWGDRSGNSGWMCSLEYERKWGKYMRALQDYFEAKGFFADAPHVKGYYYTQVGLCFCCN